MKKFSYMLAAIIVVLFLIQLIPVERNNPEFDIQYSFEASTPVKEIIVNSCFDCHSNQTKWPWYSYVAPTSWLVTGHVNEGREHLNFSKWFMYPKEKLQGIKEKIIEEIEEGKMPLPGYVNMHDISEITDEKLLILKQWAFSNDADSTEQNL